MISGFRPKKLHPPSITRNIIKNDILSLWDEKGVVRQLIGKQPWKFFAEALISLIKN